MPAVRAGGAVHLVPGFIDLSVAIRITALRSMLASVVPVH